MTNRFTALFMVFSLVVCTPALADRAPLQTIGWVERIRLAALQTPLVAKIDTGADHSSVHAETWTIDERADGRWVRFTLLGENGREVEVERPLLRMVKVKKKVAGHVSRPAINLRLCIAGQMVTGQVSLSQRKRFRYPLLIGRSILANRFLVDSGRTHVSSPVCDESGSEPGETGR